MQHHRLYVLRQDNKSSIEAGQQQKKQERTSWLLLGGDEKSALLKTVLRCSGGTVSGVGAACCCGCECCSCRSGGRCCWKVGWLPPALPLPLSDRCMKDSGWLPRPARNDPHCSITGVSSKPLEKSREGDALTLCVPVAQGGPCWGSWWLLLAPTQELLIKAGQSAAARTADST